MKINLHVTFLISAAIIFCCPFAFSQITVTRTDFANAGDITINANDTLPTVNAGSAGASQTWDLSALANHYQDTTVFSNPSSTPYASSFPSANLAGYNATNAAYYYLNASTSSVNAVGYVTDNPFTGTPLILSFVPPQPQITFPSTIATTFSNSSVASSGSFYLHMVLDSATNTTADSFRITQTTIRYSLIDGWGTTITPAGTFNSLRQHVIDSTNTQIEAYVLISNFPIGWQTLPFGGNSVSTNYNFFANGQKWSIAHLGTDSAGNVTSADYLVNVTIGIPEYSFAGSTDVVIFPNPSTGDVNISVLNNKAVALSVYDMLGRNTETIQLDNISVAHSFESYAKGLYSFRVSGKNGEHLSTGKFVIE
jgi:hypothetical protein